MKKSTKHAWHLFAGIAILCSGCQSESPLEVEKSISQEQVNQANILLDRETTDLTANDAVTVASLFNSTKENTRSGIKGDITNVVTIKDDEGNPMIYAVNYEEGYILISATTSFYPILAVVDKGHYSTENKQTGQQLIIGDNIENIRAAKSGDVKFPVEHLWNKYIKDDAISQEESKIRAQSDEYWEAYNNWYADMCKNGTPNIYLLSRGVSGLPDNIYQEFKSVASSEDPWVGTEYNWKQTAYVVERTTYSYNNTEALLKTQWSQEDKEFNINTYPLGCVTVAVGQLMKYYQKPSSIDWSQMPNNYGNDALRSFLATLRSELKVSEKGGAKFSDAERVLKNYGYSFESTSHNANKIYSSIRGLKPVFATGFDEISGEGHAWVIDGIHQSTTKIEYTLYVLSDAQYPEFKYVSADGCYYVDQSDVTTYHMNWGWRGSDDGYYIDQRPWITGKDPVTNQYIYKYKFSKDRKEIIFK